MEVDSKEYSWKWVTGDELLSRGPCEFLYCRLTTTNDEAEATLYDGENASGKQILRIFTTGYTNPECRPMKPIYCRRGLYLGSLSNANLLVQWRELGHKGGGG